MCTSGLRPARNVDADFGRFAVFDLVPFGRNGEQFAVAVATRDIGQQGCGQGFGLADFLAALLDDAFVRELAQQLLQRGAVGVLEAELARDLTRADLAGVGANEGDDGVRRRKAAVALSCHSSAHFPKFVHRLSTHLSRTSESYRH